MAKVAPAAATRKPHVVGVVGVGEKHCPIIVLEKGAHKAVGIPRFGAKSEVGIRENALVHALLNAKVEHRLLVAIVDTRYASEVAALVVRLNLVYNRRWQVF